MRDLAAFDRWCRSILDIDGFVGLDDSLNGIQVERSSGPIDKVAFAVDACAESIRRAASAGAQVLFVHHGLLWGRPLCIGGALKQRLRLLFDADMALYACHLPLDSHPRLGNNAALCAALGLSNPQPFGEYRSRAIGLAGALDEPLDIDEVLRRVLPAGGAPLSIIPAGPERIRSAAVISGGGARDVRQAIIGGYDLYLTGESSHSIYHEVIEARINFVAAGHYATETGGLKAVAELLAREAGTRSVFIDLPTGL